MRTWADDFNTYQDACDFYGCDGPRELAIEAAYLDAEAAIENQDWMEAHGRPLPNFALMFGKDIPF
jgi:hypothetical protein